MSEIFKLDRATILERFGGDEDLLETMIGLFLEDSGRYCDELEAALARDDLDRVRREAHTLKGLLATLADDKGREVAYAAEILARDGQREGLPEAVATLLVRVRLVIDTLSQRNA